MQENISIVVQVNGKLRDTILIQSIDVKNQPEIEKRVRESEKVSRHFTGKEIKKVIYIEGKLINFVVL